MGDAGPASVRCRTAGEEEEDFAFEDEDEHEDEDESYRTGETPALPFAGGTPGSLAAETATLPLGGREEEED